ncbi:hypothetical protein BI316_02390 [Xanthomonas citri pv. citri]|nr:hypothetical protein BI316_02390 [Xanthomonas citri pv. citri]
MGNGEWGMGNGEWGMGKREAGSGKREAGSGKREAGSARASCRLGCDATGQWYRRPTAFVGGAAALRDPGPWQLQPLRRFPASRSRSAAKLRPSNHNVLHGQASAAATCVARQPIRESVPARRRKRSACAPAATSGRH